MPNDRIIEGLKKEITQIVESNAPATDGPIAPDPKTGMMSNERCPKCGAGVLYTGRTPELHRNYTKYTCNYVAYEDGGQDEAYNCLRRQLTAAQEEIERLREGLTEALPILREAAQPYNGYGSFLGGDPRNFFPDSDSTTEAELARHKEDCEKWNRAEAECPPETPAGEWLSEHIHVLHACYGLGCYTIPAAPKYTRALDAARALLGEEARDE